MEVSFQLLDCDYVNVDGRPVLRLFGKTREGKTVCAFYRGYRPYFYVRTEDREGLLRVIEESFRDEVLGVEEVERFLPLGYNPNKVKMFKLTLKNPAKTPEVRDTLKKKVDCEVYEADILFRYRFMADFGISGMKWLRVHGERSATNRVNVDITLECKKLEEEEVHENVKFKYLSVDIEVPTKGGIPSPEKDEIGIISLAFYPAFHGRSTLVLVSKPVRAKDKDVLVFPSEKEMLEKFVEIVNAYDPDVITGYNILAFDIPYINERLKENKLPRTLGRCKDKCISVRKISESKYRCSVVGRVLVDPYLIIKEMAARGFFVGLKRFGLGDVSEYFLGEKKVDVAHSEIFKLWNGSWEEVNKLLDYARKDAQLALKILLEKGFLEKYVAISQVSGLLLQDALDSGESAKIENLLLREFNKEGFVFPCKPKEEVEEREEERDEKGLKGAFVLEPEVGLHTKCVVYLDFMSMYPSLIIAFNICPTTILLDNGLGEGVESVETPYGSRFVSPKVRLGIFPRVVKELIEKRQEFKRRMKEEKDPAKRRVWDAKQEAFKRMANAFYGYTGFIRARLYLLEIANSITSLGRKYITLTKRIVEGKTPYKVIYGDTDSIFIKTDTDDVEEALRVGEELAELITREVKVLKMKLEGVFRTLLINAKKRYAGWCFERKGDKLVGKIVMKGIETVRKDWCELVGETLEKILEIILKEQDPGKALKYFRKVVEDLQEGRIPLEKLVIVKGLSKRVEDYKGTQPHVELVKKMMRRKGVKAPGVGDRVGFVIVKGVEQVSERAEDPEWVKLHNLPVDSRYYVESQLLPPVERIFEAMGIKKSELLSFGRQLQLAEVTQRFNGKDAGSAEIKVEDVKGVICKSCRKTYSTIPLSGKCVECKGELLFYSEKLRSEYVVF